MTMDRIIGVFTFRKEVYSEVEHDTSFTTTAWLIVIIVAFLNQLGTFAKVDILGWLVGAVVGTIFTVIGFAVAAAIISWVGKAVFHAEVSFDEMVRTLGLAYVWNVIGVLGILGLVPALACNRTSNIHRLDPWAGGLVHCSKRSPRSGVAADYHYRFPGLDRFGDYHRARSTHSGIIRVRSSRNWRFILKTYPKQQNIKTNPGRLPGFVLHEEPRIGEDCEMMT